MVACQICHSIFEVPTKIARVRHQSYLEPMWSDLFTSEHMAIDVIISPEIEVARAIERPLQLPGAFDVQPLANSTVSLVGLHCSRATPTIHTPLRQPTPRSEERRVGHAGASTCNPRGAPVHSKT